ncbi:MAG TPA: DHA2 family efflux MFS transporter permease subunit [Micropepsaceae bacterium]|nr:DHA2 family efflux MFS transporter permease subunit [Micropepsaceae bacterium]
MTSAVSAEGNARHRWAIMGCTMIATLMQALDNTIANVALPHMQGSLGASRDQITWVLTSYVIAAAILTAPVGWLSARFGRKPFFIVSLVGFTITSMLCGLAQTLPQEVAFRFLQGCFGAALVPLSQSVMLDLYPMESRGTAMAIWGTGVMIGPILGPTLGGYLTDIYNWRWVFFINVPFGIVAVAGLVMFLRDRPSNATLRFDWTGFLALSAALGGLQMLLDRGYSQDWFSSNEIVIEAIVAGLGFYLFIVHMLTAEKPFIPPRIFKDIGFLSGFATMFAVGVVLLGSSALLPPYLQNLGGYSVTQTGLLMTPRGIGTMLVMMIAGRLTRVIDPRLLMGVGVVCIAWAMWDMTQWTPDIGLFRLAVVSLIQGAGIALVFIPLQVVGFATLPASLRTDAAALYSLSRNIGSAIGVSATSTLLASSFQTVHSQLAEQITPFNRALQSGTQGMFMGPMTPFGLQGAEAQIQYHAYVSAYANDFLLMFWTCLPLLPLLFFMRKPRAQKSDVTELALE